MTKDSAILVQLSRAGTQPLSPALRQRTLALARSSLPPPGRRPRSLRIADTTPPLYLVPSLLISAAAVFVIEVVVKAARHFWLS